jgi:glycine/D-amino acid oxidase-like deaminating enzyme
VSLAGGAEIATGKLVLAAGPLLHEAGRMLGVELPLHHELHAKVTMRDPLRAVPRDAPFLLLADPVRLSWSDAERERLTRDQHDARLLREMPEGVHIRPVDGAHGNELYVIWTYETDAVTPEWPPRFRASYSEAVLRGAAALVPAMGAYRAPFADAKVDGGYYCKTPENRPLVGPLDVQGAWVCGALSGYGVMAAQAAGELVAAHVTGSKLPDYAGAFHPARCNDPGYSARVAATQAHAGQL